MQLVTVHTAFNVVEADLVFARLSAAGFNPVITHGLAGTMNEGYVLASGGILVQVPDNEATEAGEFLTSSTEMPPE